MTKYLFILLLSFTFTLSLSASKIKGVIIDKETNEPLIGAIVKINELNTGTVTGLDGSFKIKHLPKGVYTISVTHIGYEASTLQLNTEEKDEIEDELIISLGPNTKSLHEVEVVGHADKSTEVSARLSERESPNLLNVTSASAIQLSPDLEVASVIQRMSGVTLDRSSSKGNEYAILRGMDKRYSYTLVNGIKIPSTDDRHRYINLDIFPSDLVDRIEVSKALTPNMESDAIAGAVNIVMKNAPDKLLIKANISSGYNTILHDHPFRSFNSDAISILSPYEINGKEYDAKPSDFTKANLDNNIIKLPVNTIVGFAIGNRFFEKRLGWILALNYNNTYRGKSSLIFDSEQANNSTNQFILTEIERRFDYRQQENMGIHNKIDFDINRTNSIKAYLAYFNNQIKQNRESDITSLQFQSYVPSLGESEGYIKNRNDYNIQSLLTTTLQGDHGFFNQHLHLNWSGVYSKATNQTPDLSTITYDNFFKNSQRQPQFVNFSGSTREWFHNSDLDKAFYGNIKYVDKVFGGNLEISTGYLYRDKIRNSFVNTYTLIPVGPVNERTAKGVDWTNYSDINWTIKNPKGAVNEAGTFNAYENDRAVYGMIQYQIHPIRIIGGLRHEQANQGYDLLFHNPFLDKFTPNNYQKKDNKYIYNLPSVNIEYTLQNGNIKGSYYKAINKPGFLEIVPFEDNRGEFAIVGNEKLRNAVAENCDIRYQYYPTQLDQILIGGFYKKITDAIEEGFIKYNSGKNALTFLNSNALVYGFEIDGVKFFREIGVKFNYTWSHSQTTSNKKYIQNGIVNKDSTYITAATRPLAGQSEHIANISLLYKGSNNGLNAQLAMSYNSDRIIRVSSDLNADRWEKGIFQLDFSAEKNFKSGLSIFIKARNLLNSHVIWYVKQHDESNNKFPYHENDKITTIVRNEYTGSSVLIGLRYKL